MLYSSNATKQKQTVCGQDKVHKLNQEQLVKDCHSMQEETNATGKKRGIKVVLQFPEEVDPKAEEEFKCRLKEIYLRKIKFGSMQVEESALQSTPPVKGELRNMEDKKYE